MNVWTVLLLDWLTSLFAWAVLLAFVAVVFFMGRWSGRLAERRDQEVVETAETVRLPRQREPV